MMRPYRETLYPAGKTSPRMRFAKDCAWLAVDILKEILTSSLFTILFSPLIICAGVLIGLLTVPLALFDAVLGPNHEPDYD